MTKQGLPRRFRTRGHTPGWYVARGSVTRQASQRRVVGTVLFDSLWRCRAHRYTAVAPLDQSDTPSRSRVCTPTDPATAHLLGSLPLMGESRADDIRSLCCEGFDEVRTSTDRPMIVLRPRRGSAEGTRATPLVTKTVEHGPGGHMSAGRDPYAYAGMVGAFGGGPGGP